MELRTLRYFLAIVDHGSVTAAAREVHIAQPAVSRQIQALEAELGVELFLRDGRRLRLGPAGRRLLPIVRDLVAPAAGRRRVMAGGAGPSPGIQVHLAVAAHPTTIADVIAPFVASRREPLRDSDLRRGLGRRSVRRSGPRRGRPRDLHEPSAPGRRLAARRQGSRSPGAELLEPPVGSGRARRLCATLLRQPLCGPRPHSRDAARLRGRGAPHHGSYRMAAEVGVPGIAQAMAASGIGVAILTDDPAYDLRRLY